MVSKFLNIMVQYSLRSYKLDLDHHLETVEGHRTRKHSESSILYTPTSIPYKANTGALLY